MGEEVLHGPRCGQPLLPALLRCRVGKSSSSSSSSSTSSSTSSPAATKANATAASSSRRLQSSYCSDCSLPSPRLNTWQVRDHKLNTPLLHLVEKATP